VKVTGNENVKIIFRAYLCQKWIDLSHMTTKIISGSFYTYLPMFDIFHHRRMIRFYDNLYSL